MIHLIIAYIIIIDNIVKAQEEEEEYEADEKWWLALVILIIILLSLILPQIIKKLFIKETKDQLSKTGLIRVSERARYRLSSINSHVGEVPSILPPDGRYTGEYRERMEQRLIEFNLNFTNDGKVNGHCHDYESIYIVNGLYHKEREVYILCQMGIDQKYVSWEDPDDVKKEIIESRAMHYETELSIVDANRGELRGSSICSTGIMGFLHLKYDPIRRSIDDI